MIGKLDFIALSRSIHHFTSIQIEKITAIEFIVDLPPGMKWSQTKPNQIQIQIQMQMHIQIQSKEKAKAKATIKKTNLRSASSWEINSPIYSVTNSLFWMVCFANAPQPWIDDRPNNKSFRSRVCNPTLRQTRSDSGLSPGGKSA